jgi:hypothetical protein
MSIGNIMGRRDPGKHVDAIRLEETIDYVLEGTSPKTTLLAFNMLIKHIWHGHFDLIQTAARSQLDRLKPVVEHQLEGAGWEVHILDSLKRSEVADNTYIHAACYGLQVQEVLFSAKLNTELRLDELCNESGEMRNKEETLALLKERIGLDTFDLEELSEEDRDHVLAIMRQEERDLEYLHDVNVTGQELTTGARSFRWFRDEEEGKQDAMEYLTDDDDLWKGAVAAGDTTEGLEEWAKDALRMNGWAGIIGGYDGMEREAQLKYWTWFPYVRSD